MSITLICYIAVASVHAFPSSLSTFETSPAAQDTSTAGMSPSCHKQIDETQSKAASACKIFCAAMSNIIVDNFAVYLSPNEVGTEIAFRLKGVAKLSFAMEPHPPK